MHFWAPAVVSFFVGLLQALSFCSRKKRQASAQHKPAEAARLGAGRVVSFFFSQVSLADVVVVFLKSAGHQKKTLCQRKRYNANSKKIGEGQMREHIRQPAFGRIPCPFFHSKAIGRTPRPRHSARHHCARVEGRVTHKRKKRLGSCSSLFRSSFFFDFP